MFVPLSSCQNDLESSLCGNGVVEPGEDCDGWREADLYRWRTSCVDWGWHDGYVGCTPGCRLDFAACEHSGRCGDGVIARRFEDCDGANLGNETCATLGTHGGTLACTPDCRFDLAGCAACGDGVLQPEYGEQVEFDLDRCAGAGTFGGAGVTYDCQVASTRYCGDYRLITGPGSVKDPVPVLDASGELWLAGIVQGAFDGFGNPGCPHLEPLTWEVVYSPEDVYAYEDGYYYPDCDDHFFGPAGATANPAVTLQEDDDAPPLQALELGAHGFAVLRHREAPGEQRFVIDWIAPDGTLRHTEEVNDDAGPDPPRLVSAGSDEFALFTFTRGGDVLRVSRLSVATPGLIGTFALPRIDFEGADYASPVHFHYFLAWGEAAGRYRVLQTLQTGENHHELFLYTLDVSGEQAQVGELVRVDGLTFTPGGVARPEPDGSVLLAGVADGIYPKVLVLTGRLTPDGQVTVLSEFELSEGIIAPSFFPMPDGGWLVGGMVHAHFGMMTPQVTSCWQASEETLWPHVAALRLDGAGALVGSAYFYAPGLIPTYFGGESAQGVACGTHRIRYLADGESLVAAGAWDRSSFFCSQLEPTMLYQLEPVHACGIYLVRLTPEP
ncbi:hypothetical protein KJ612_02115 [Myxococcota bacterium]|nr:hypothetical protein [Myxococcota bacterium]